jgi:hypothetical protein
MLNGLGHSKNLLFATNKIAVFKPLGRKATLGIVGRKRKMNLRILTSVATFSGIRIIFLFFFPVSVTKNLELLFIIKMSK